jgi:hypothetical protein
MVIVINSRTEVSNLYSHNILFLDESPPPNLYNLKSEFNPIPGVKAISFGIAREAYTKVFIKEHPPRDPNIPGPG